METLSPTKHPTIARPEDDIYEVIPLLFKVGNLPDDINLKEMHSEMTMVLKRILLRLSDRIEGLKIKDIEQKTVVSSRGRDRRGLVNGAGGGSRLLRDSRSLEQDASLYYNVYVVRDDKKKFGPIIIQELRDSFNEVLEQIQ